MAFIAFVSNPTQTSGAELSIQLPGVANVTRTKVTYACDAAGQKIGLPPGKFDVEYVQAGTNSFVVLLIAGQTLIFAGVSSGSGARYNAQQYTWWESHGGASLYSDSLNGKLLSSCSQAKH